MARFCTSCGSPMDDGAAFCSKCGKGSAAGSGAGPGAAAAAAAAPSAPVASAGGLTDNIAGMLAYITFIPAIYFLVTPPYNSNRFVRFHSLQSLGLFVAWVVVGTVAWMIPIVNLVIGPLVGLAFLVIWVFTLFKAYSGQMWKIPVVGDIVEKQANA